MSVHTAGQVVQSVKLFAGNNVGSCRKDFVFVGLCGANKTKKSGSRRRKVGGGVNSWDTQRNLLGLRKNWASSVKSVLDVERVNNASRRQSSDLKPKAANLEDIISERGACGVGFIANLDNRASHEIVKDALTALGCMEHRGGCGADNDSGDGSGVMTSIPWELFNSWANEQGMTAFDQMHTGVGMVFLPKDDALLQQAQTGHQSYEVLYLLMQLL